jgi:hypothetical protein
MRPTDAERRGAIRVMPLVEPVEELEARQGCATSRISQPKHARRLRRSPPMVEASQPAPANHSLNSVS